MLECGTALKRLTPSRNLEQAQKNNLQCFNQLRAFFRLCVATLCVCVCRFTAFSLLYKHQNPATKKQDRVAQNHILQRSWGMEDDEKEIREQRKKKINTQHKHKQTKTTQHQKLERKNEIQKKILQTVFFSSRCCASFALAFCFC
jgi:hypothetical protein